MNNTWKWIVGVVIVLALLFALPFVFSNIFGFNSYGHMMDDYGGWNHPMMGGWGFGGVFMGFGMLLVWAVPLGLLFLVIYGAIRLANQSNHPAAAQTCSNCSKPAQTEWNTCPYCGEGL